MGILLQICNSIYCPSSPKTEYSGTKVFKLWYVYNSSMKYFETFQVIHVRIHCLHYKWYTQVGFIFVIRRGNHEQRKNSKQDVATLLMD
jgi:hypothetical protein